VTLPNGLDWFNLKNQFMVIIGRKNEFNTVVFTYLYTWKASKSNGLIVFGVSLYTFPPPSGSLRKNFSEGGTPHPPLRFFPKDSWELSNPIYTVHPTRTGTHFFEPTKQKYYQGNYGF